MARGHPQRIPNRLIPREVYKADEDRCRARPAHGNDSGDTSVSNENEETDNEENRDRSDKVQVGRGNDHKKLEEEAIEATDHWSMTSMFKRVIMCLETDRQLPCMMTR